MLYLAIPAHNEAATIGVLLWRLRTVLAEFPREYEAVVYDDASSDSTSEILENYAKVMPLTVLRGDRQVGYAAAVDALVRHVARDTRYPRRDAMLLLQGDFTDSPSFVPEFVKRFEGGTDIVVGERDRTVRRKAPAPVKRLLQVEPWLTRFLVRAEGIRDLTCSYRLVRISVLRDLLRTVGDTPVCVGDPRTANADFLMRIVPLARRVEVLPVEPTWDVRLRETRVVAVPDAMTLLRWAWRSRGGRAVPSTAPETTDAPRQPRSSREGRTDLRLEGRPDATADVANVTENGRGAGNRDAGGGRNRKSRSARNESKTEVRTELSGDGRSRVRAPRADVRPDAQADSRTEPRTDAKLDQKAGAGSRTLPVASSALTDSDITVELEMIDGITPNERPPRRKRTRGGRRERLENASGASADAATADSGDASNESGAASGGSSLTDGEATTRQPAVPSPASVESDATLAEFPSEVELSPSLRDAVDDVELELDGDASTRPPRKRRRRRGSRGARSSESTAEGEDSADIGADPFDGTELSLERVPHARSSDFVDGDAGSDDAGSDTLGSDAPGSDAADSDGDADPEGRPRRRGRRGRRGGSRRSRTPRQERENNDGGEDFSAPPPSAPASAPEL